MRRASYQVRQAKPETGRGSSGGGTISSGPSDSLAPGPAQSRTPVGDDRFGFLFVFRRLDQASARARQWLALRVGGVRRINVMRELIRGAGEDERPADLFAHRCVIRAVPARDRVDELFRQIFGQIVANVRRSALGIGHERVRVVGAWTGEDRWPLAGYGDSSVRCRCLLHPWPT